MRYRWPTLLGLFLALMLLPHFLSSYYQGVLVEVLIFGLYCMGFDIIFGFTGLLNFGMSVFFGLGGYIALLSIVHLQTDLWGSLALTVIGSGLFSAIYGLLISRFKSHFFVAFTIVISMIFFYMAMAMRPITGADEGLTFTVPELKLGFTTVSFYSNEVKYYFVLFICAAVFFLVRKFFGTPFGKAVLAVRENEGRARMIGYNTTGLKIASFTLSGIVASLGGALYVLHLGFTSAHSFFWIWTARAVWWTIIGGVGWLLGGFVGPAVLVFFEDFLSSWSPNWYLIIMGVIMIVVIIFAPQGILGTIDHFLARKEK
jgi:branched-chain amino acid transport system permease protein